MAKKQTNLEKIDYLNKNENLLERVGVLVPAIEFNAPYDSRFRALIKDYGLSEEEAGKELFNKKRDYSLFD